MSLLAKLKAMADADKALDEQLPLIEVVQRIVKLNEGLRSFWSSSHGWAPADAAELMGKSRLDRQASLSRSLLHWITADEELEDGDLILGWTNLGSLIEGTIKLFLAVYYEDFKADFENVKKTQAWHSKQEKVLEPDGLRLEVLVHYVETAKLFQGDDLALFKLVQQRRNAIHAFKDRDIGTPAELHSAMRAYLRFLRDTASRLPYPDDLYEPREL
ncbi:MULTISPECIES: hypothetical protein [Brevundimonas]|jgi:hypothetical protein|uniref:Uncharacterized protein n=2 Tax=Brevundimonas mediterranea TaxID=74329 RepID=A0A7Z8Y1N1_9CAUL|nr:MULTISPECIES: hypothetical protein [Brevundimonas]MCG2665181.1 hypothetical protein [Brevundimonas sp.]VDC49075.1 hypothetical protein BREV_BREV_03454 [Brevundimonas mediterranea]